MKWLCNKHPSGNAIRLMAGWVMAVFALAPAASAQSISQLNQLRFGTIVVADTTSDQHIEMAPNGSINTISPGLYLHTPGQPGEYNFTGGTPNANYTISVSPTATLNGSVPSTFTVDNFTISPSSFTTDGNGDATTTFKLGGRLTAHSGGTYGNGTYSGTLDITVTEDN